MKQVKNNKLITTKRLVLEPLTPNHAGFLFEPFSDPELYHYVFWEVPTSVESLKEFFQKICSGGSKDGKQIWLNWAAKTKDSGEYSGFFEATVEQGKTMLAYYTFQAFKKKGLAKEGVLGVMTYLKEEFSVKTFVLEMDTRNRASVRLAESLGFVWQKTMNNVCELKGYQSHEFVYQYNVNA